MRAVPTDLWIFLAGLVAGSVNAAAGGGTLLAFPVLIGVAHLSPFLAAMGLLLPRPIGELNALRILNAMINNSVAALTFIALEALHPTGALDFHAALPLALGSVIGGWAGVRVARRLPAMALRGIAACVGIAIGVYLAVTR